MTTTSELARQLGITSQQLRRWLRSRYPRPQATSGTQWTLTSEQEAAAHAHFPGRSRTPARGPQQRSAPGRASHGALPAGPRGMTRRAAFKGFRPISALWRDGYEPISEKPGVYLILRASQEPPAFLARSTGGHFKGKDPTVTIPRLQNEWVPAVDILYIGKAGTDSGGVHLRTRLKQYLEFGRGLPKAHWGGRLIWQLRDAPELVVAWRETPGESPRDVERRMIAEFESAHGRLPFANLQR